MSKIKANKYLLLYSSAITLILAVWIVQLFIINKKKNKNYLNVKQTFVKISGMQELIVIRPTNALGDGVLAILKYTNNNSTLVINHPTHLRELSDSLATFYNLSLSDCNTENWIELSKVLTFLYFDPSSRVLDKAFYQLAEPDLDFYCKKNSNLFDVLKRLCQDPQIEQSEFSASVKFNILSNIGSVFQVTVYITNRFITKITSDELFPPETFCLEIIGGITGVRLTD